MVLAASAPAAGGACAWLIMPMGGLQQQLPPLPLLLLLLLLLFNRFGCIDRMWRTDIVLVFLSLSCVLQILLDIFT